MELLTLISNSSAGYGSLLLLTFLLVSSFVRTCLIICFINIGLGLNNFLGNIWGLIITIAICLHTSSPLIEESNAILSKNSVASQEETISQLNTHLKNKLELSTPKETINLILGIKKEEATNKNNLPPPSFNSLILAHVLSETKIALSAGLKILLPFIVVDLVVANIFTALGIVTLSASGLAFLLKILAINYTGGLDLIIQNLIKSF